MEDNTELKEMLTKAIEPKLKEQFNMGLMAGWHSCCMAIEAQIRNMTSAKQIKQFLKQKRTEVQDKLGLKEDANAD